MELDNNKIGHYCGLASMYSAEPTDVPRKLFYPLFAQQHRGQESAGIAYYNISENRIYSYKDIGLVANVLTRYLKKDIKCRVGIGHVRYSSDGGYKAENVQPFHVSCNKGEIAVAHNGSITNAKEIREELQKIGAIFQTSSDAEVIFHLLSRSQKDTLKENFIDVLNRLEGAFCLVMMIGDSLIGIRDKYGYRPLYLGKKDGAYYIVSETCGLDSLGVKEYREIEPGEVVVIDKNGYRNYNFTQSPKKQQCIFEFIYFARPDSEIYGKSVYLTRKKMGAMLSTLDNNIGDIVVPVQTSGNIAALGYAQESGLPFEFGLNRNYYAGRSFILPTSEERELAVKMKLNPDKNVVNGKRIILVDDSIVRGTTSRLLIKILREAGAKEIHLRLTAPELHFPCLYGVDIPTYEELISNSKTPEQIAEYIGADSVKFLSVDDLKKCVDNPEDFCYSCFDGKYGDR